MSGLGRLWKMPKRKVQTTENMFYPEIRIWKQPAPAHFWKPNILHDENWKRYFWLGWVIMFKQKEKTITAKDRVETLKWLAAYEETYEETEEGKDGNT